MVDRYILDANKNIVFCTDLTEWANWYEAAHVSGEIIVRKTWIGNFGIEISTVFLGIDHNFSSGEADEDYEPILFETMVFSTAENDNEVMFRASTYAEALETHYRTLGLVMKNYLHPAAKKEIIPGLKMKHKRKVQI